MSEYPNTLFVQKDIPEENEVIFLAEEKKSGVNDGEVAIYELKKIAAKTTKIEIK